MTLHPLRDDTCLLALPMHEGEGNIFYDHSRYSHNATFYGDTTDWLDSPFGKVIFFAGTDNYYAKVSGHEIMSKIAETKALTVTVWINTGEDGQILYDCHGFPYPLCGMIELALKDDGKIYWNGGGTNGWDCPETSESFNDGQWHFIAALADHSISRIYVDGELKSEGTGWSEWSPFWTDSDKILYIGTNYPEGSDLFSDFLCDLRIYNRVLSQEEIKALELYYRNFEVRPSILCPRPTL